MDNQGIGRLVDGNIDQYMKFKGQNLIVTMNWDSPTNISGKNVVHGSLIWVLSQFLTDILVLSLFTQHTSSSCLNEIEIENESKSFLYRISCSSKPGRREIPIHLNTVTSQLTIKLKFSGYIYLSEVSWTSGPIENTTHEILYPSQQSILVVSFLRYNVKLNSEKF